MHTWQSMEISKDASKPHTNINFIIDSDLSNRGFYGGHDHHRANDSRTDSKWWINMRQSKSLKKLIRIEKAKKEEREMYPEIDGIFTGEE